MTGWSPADTRALATKPQQSPGARDPRDSRGSVPGDVTPYFAEIRCSDQRHPACGRGSTQNHHDDQRAMEVLMIEPRGISTGRADAKSVTAVQKMRPASTSTWGSSKTWSRIASPMGIARLVAASAKAQTATSPTM